MMNSFNLHYENNEMINGNNNLDSNLIDEFLEISDEPMIDDSISTLSSKTRAGVIENQPRGGSWVDEFEDENSVDAKSNLVFIEDKILNNNYRRQDFK
jgi:hypothetical protein